MTEHRHESVGLPAGLTPPILIAFGVFFVLGFALYAALYAGAASVVVVLWFAGRLYSAGVFMYGQKPSLRNLLRAARSG